MYRKNADSRIQRAAGLYGRPAPSPERERHLSRFDFSKYGASNQHARAFLGTNGNGK
jgi:hypothetical protein